MACMGQSISYPGAKDSILLLIRFWNQYFLQSNREKRKEIVAVRIVLQLIEGISQGEDHWENPLLEPRFRCFRQPMIYAKREVNYIGLYIVFQRTSILKNLSIELVPTTFFIGKRGCSLAFASGSSSIDTIGVISTWGSETALVPLCSLPVCCTPGPGGAGELPELTPLGDTISSQPVTLVTWTLLNNWRKRSSWRHFFILYSPMVPRNCYSFDSSWPPS